MFILLILLRDGVQLPWCRESYSAWKKGATTENLRLLLLLPRNAVRIALLGYRSVFVDQVSSQVSLILNEVPAPFCATFTPYSKSHHEKFYQAFEKKLLSGGLDQLLLMYFQSG